MIDYVSSLELLCQYGCYELAVQAIMTECVVSTYCAIVNGNIYSWKLSKIVSEYDQEIPQLQTADKPMTSRGRAIPHDNHETLRRQTKQVTSSLFPICFFIIENEEQTFSSCGLARIVSDEIATLMWHFRQLHIIDRY